jgi:hypothetical protein
MKHAKTFVSLWAQAGGKEGACGVKKSVPKEVAVTYNRERNFWNFKKITNPIPC